MGGNKETEHAWMQFFLGNAYMVFTCLEGTCVRVLLLGSDISLPKAYFDGSPLLRTVRI